MQPSCVPKTLSTISLVNKLSPVLLRSTVSGYAAVRFIRRITDAEVHNLVMAWDVVLAVYCFWRYA